MARLAGSGCPAGCCPHAPSDGNPRSGQTIGASGRSCPPDVPGAELPDRVRHLYACQGMSTYRIAGIVQIGRQRVTTMLHRSGVPVGSRGAGRSRPRRTALAVPDRLMRDLYLRRRLTCAQISALTGIPARTIRDRLVGAGVQMRTKGRCNREDRLEIEPSLLAFLYSRSGMSADAVGRLTGVSRKVVLRAAQDYGLPVRMGGDRAPRLGPAQIELIEALNGDPEVRRILARHGCQAVPAGGPIWRRHPAPEHLSADLATELYESCGLATTHIELLTGQPAATVGRLLRNAGVPLRPAGGRSPFLRRWRADFLAWKQAG